jgi:hypothetical protein
MSGPKCVDQFWGSPFEHVHALVQISDVSFGIEDVGQFQFDAVQPALRVVDFVQAQAHLLEHGEQTAQTL